MKKLLLLISFVFYTMCINAQSVSFSFDSTMFIPDPTCPFSAFNYASVNVSSFALTDTIHDTTDILSICINIEHSSAGDLGFRLYCPNGRSVALDGNFHSGTNNLGNPNTQDGSSVCIPASNPQGTGWNYCWSTFYPNNNTTLNQLSVSTGVGTILVGNYRTVDSTDVYNHSNYLKPDSTLTSLIGCPLNGIWSIRIIDDYYQDNGYIFGWSVELSPTFVTPSTPTISLIGDTLFSDAPLGNQWYNLATGAIAGDTGSFYLPLQTGDYFTIVSINGQTSDSSNIIHYIYTPPTPVISLIGDTLFSDAPLGNQWYNLATGALAGATASKYHPLQTGDYFTTVTLNGQTSDTSNIIHYICTPPTPVISLIGDTLFSDALMGNQWYNLATGAIYGATAAKYHPLQTGDYFTLVTLNGQTSDSSNIIHYIHTGIEANTANCFHVKVIPNPFTAKTNIKYYLTEASQVSLIIMDITGKEIQKPVSGKQAKGEQNIVFTADGYPSGLYFYKLIINDSTTVGKLMLNN